jgi:hypothetical protein
MTIRILAFNMVLLSGIIIKMDGDSEGRAMPSQGGAGFLMIICHSPFQDIAKDSIK